MVQKDIFKISQNVSIIPHYLPLKIAWSLNFTTSHSLCLRVLCTKYQNLTLIYKNMHVCMSTQKDKAIEKIPWSISIRLNINCYTVYSISLSCILKTKWNETDFLWEWMHYKQVRYICVSRYKVVPYFYLFCLSKEIRPKFYLSSSLYFFYFSDTSFFTKTNSCCWWQFIVQNILSLFCI